MGKRKRRLGLGMVGMYMRPRKCDVGRGMYGRMVVKKEWWMMFRDVAEEAGCQEVRARPTVHG